MPSQPKIDLAKLRSQISARLIIHSQFLLVWFGMPGMPVAKPVGHEIGMPSVTDFDVSSIS